MTHLCAMPGCAVVLTRGRRCAAHAVAVEHTRRNRAVRRWYFTARWRALRAEILRRQAYACAACGTVTAALEVDHVVKHQGDPGRFWDRDNLQGLCRPCHQRKTQRGE